MTRTVLALGLCLTAISGYCASEQPLAAFERRILTGRRGRQPEGLFRTYAIEALVHGQPVRGLGVLAQFFANALPADTERIPSANELEQLCPAADAYLLLRLFHDRQARIQEPVARWLFGSDAALALFLDTITLEDDWHACLRVIETLFAHDPEKRDELHALILAFAVVWDQEQPPMHRQMGGGQLPYSREVVPYYDYFRDLYLSRKAKISYSDLSVTALTFVVHVPVPLSELQWARENVRGSARSWGRKFTDIGYDESRLASATYQWPWGNYTLAKIREKGGICVDQAYYATITARAFGIPALMFVGEGRRGPHAWFGYLENRDKWELETGRYRFDRYATGHALDPQVNRPMTDHDLQYTCDRALRSGSYANATRLTRLAIVLHDLQRHQAALRCAELSIGLSRVYHLPWQIREQILAQQGRPRDVLALLDEKANAFRQYPDVLLAVRKRQADLLREYGDPKAAERLLQRKERRVASDRDDLLRSLVSEQINAAVQSGDFEQARRLFEDLLRKQKFEGQKVLNLLEAYLDLTQQTDQTKEAARFLRRYIEPMRRRYGKTPHNEAVLLGFLLRAYENDGDEREADRIRRRVERLQ